MTVIDDLLNLLLPTTCAICRRSGAPVCRTCGELFALAPRSTWRGELRGLAITDYDDQSIKLIRAFKEFGQTSVGKFMAGHMATQLEPRQNSVTEFCLVPMPSSADNRLVRGYSPALVLARQVAARSGHRVHDALVFSRKVADQSGLSFAERQTNLQFSMRAKTTVAGKTVVLIDDVVTTGATLLEAARALAEAGAQVAGFLTFSETMLKIDHKYLKTRTKN